ncbi:MAG: aromatic ring-hydroxylating dioxygenase subunit alpha [Oscillatoriales cyanobacterium RM1_1_9]|nr:aromatic ring-hydroxylating dioxygenase subunit alpha [Oscillatoriales cyanobacterium SM2_3_0]NJO46935.1 aromatic ring-hydroxylating dioxygenase subunit alpha [Oscillatoriales cyanobacterium RM2_1_1]NJO70966.1 aromatic ring-hydroxylating dioxygenase subunit alpha [Oscillatoriales cyanobacterium RM1_1_9]
MTANSDIRQLGINLNHWYVVAQSSEVTDQPLNVNLWNQSIVLFRDCLGTVHGLEDRCPHRHVRLSHGIVIQGNLECAYHGWQFNGNGQCVQVPYLAENQRLPTCQLRRYLVQEQDGFIWLFPGKDSTQAQIPEIPEWTHLNYIATVSVIHCQTHYSFLIENLMDMYHGHLHQDLQAWTDARLEKIQENQGQVEADYQAQSYYKIDKIWSVSQLFIPALRRLHPERLRVSYVYPHWISSLGKDFKIYCLFCPINLTETRAYLIHFTSLESFWRLHKLPVKFRQWLKHRLFGAAQNLLDGLVKQDIVMIEEEQQIHLNCPPPKSHELNPVITAVQRLIWHQATGNPMSDLNSESTN